MGCPARANTKEEEKTEWKVDQVSLLFEGTPKPKVGSHRLDWMSHFIPTSSLTVPTILWKYRRQVQRDPVELRRNSDHTEGRPHCSALPGENTSHQDSGDQGLEEKGILNITHFL